MDWAYSVSNDVTLIYERKREKEETPVQCRLKKRCFDDDDVSPKNGNIVTTNE